MTLQQKAYAITNFYTNKKVHAIDCFEPYHGVNPWDYLNVLLSLDKYEYDSDRLEDFFRYEAVGALFDAGFKPRSYAELAYYDSF